MKNYKSLSKLSYNFNPILHNRIILYFISFLALIDILYLLNSGDIISFLIFIFVGLLTSFYNKNMIVILVITLSITHVFKYGSSAYKREGLENKNSKNHDYDDDDEYNDQYIGDNTKVDKEVDKLVDKVSDKVSDKVDSVLDSVSSKRDSVPNKTELKKELKDDYKDFQKIQKDIISAMTTLEPKLKKAEDFVQKFETYKNLDKKS
jgi:hypothetical protein